VVRVPSVDEEDARQLHRTRETVRNRIGIASSIA
jgi:hypothetical protein